MGPPKKKSDVVDKGVVLLRRVVGGTTVKAAFGLAKPRIKTNKRRALATKDIMVIMVDESETREE